MEQAQRANAAQLAARKIREKPRTRRTGSQTPTPTMQQQVGAMQTQTSSQNGGGGLFGGNIQATGEFSFSAPAQGLSFPSPSFGLGSNTLNTPSQNASESDGRFAGDDRATKRPFGGASTIQQSNSPFQTSDSFGQSQPGNTFGLTQQPYGGAMFSFGNSQQSGISFNSGSTTTPAKNPFTFQPASQPPPSTPSSFGSGSFSFNQQPSQTPGLFSSAPAAPQDKPANPAFSFGQTSGQLSSSSSMFGATTEPTIPTSDLFGSAPTTTMAPQVGNFFNSATSTAPTAPNIGLFSSIASAPSPASSLAAPPKAAPTEGRLTTTPFVFGRPPTTPSSSGITFGSTPATSGPTSNLFGASQPQKPVEPANSSGTKVEQAASHSNPFASLNSPAPSPVSNMFGKQDQEAIAPATSNPFNLPNASTASGATNFFGNPSPASAKPNISNPFGQQQLQPSPSSLFGGIKKPSGFAIESSAQNQQNPVGSVFGSKETQANDDLFGNLNKPVDQLIAQPKDNGKVLENGENSNSPVLNKSSLAANSFGPTKPTITSSTATNNAQPILASAQTPLTNGNLFSSTRPLEAPASAQQPPPNGMFPSPEQVGNASEFARPTVTSSAPVASTASEFVQKGHPRRHEASARQQIKEASEMTVESIASFIPANYTGFQKVAFHQGFRMRAMNKAMSTFFASINPDEDATPVVDYYKEQRLAVMGDTAALKRKTGEDTDIADHPSKRSKQSVEITYTEPHGQQSKRKLDDEDQENENPNKRTRQIESSTAARGLANGELGSSGQTSAPLNGNNLQAWQATSSGDSSSEPSLKRRASEQITKDTIQRNPLRPVKTPVTNGILESNSLGSSTSNIFKNILDSPSKSAGNSSPERKMAALPETAKDNAPRANAFANLPGASSPAKSTTVTSPSVFAAKVTPATPSASFENLFASSATSEAPNASTPKFTTASDAVVGFISTDHKSSVLKAPVFGTVTVDFQSQFVQKAEAEALKKAIEDDYDSDEDLEEFKAKWKAERLEKKKASEESAKNAKRFTFVPSTSPSSTSDEENSRTNIVATQPTFSPSSLFGQNPSSQASDSISNSLNSSRTPTPAFGSSTGSVLDGHTPGKPIKLDGIFGHLGSTNGKDGDVDEDSGDEASDPEVDSEKKDPTYQPDGESTSGPGTPAEETGPGLASAKKTNSLASKVLSVSPSGSSTPTGGFTGGLFNRINKGSNISGASTPSGNFTGGLFDRITSKDSSGNIPLGKYDDDDKEKENTQPSTATPFPALKNPFQNNAVNPSDQTWKNDSPIRFGNATPSKDGQNSTPTVSVTAATPTKKGTPSSIFSEPHKTSGAAPKPFSNLFGNIGGESKPNAPASSIFSNLSTGSTSGSVGFGFGAPSTTSSLFPSAAVSVSTSRATTPGATTDGDNSGDGEADQDEHVPFNLSTGGPGEEHEEVVHEVRAKALKYMHKEEGGRSQGWESKGVGPLRVLKHKDTGVSRILLRMDPTGLVILNKGILSGVKYEPKDKTVKFLTALDKGSGLETWILQVKTPEMAKTLAEVLEANKPT